MKKTLRQLLDSDEEVTLVVQGGGMRGVYSIAVLSELTKMGYGQRFFEVVGTSAGALNATYFLAGHPEDGVYIYTELLSGKRFIDFRRREKILDIDYLVDEIISRQVPLRKEALISNPTDLAIALASLEGKTVWKGKNEPWPITETLRAAAAMPIAYPKTVDLGGEPYIDGGVYESLGLSYALSRQAKNILLITTRDLEKIKRPSWLEQKAVHLLARRAGYPKSIIKGLVSPDESMRQAKLLASNPKSNVWAISPSGKTVSRLTRSRERLLQSAALARLDTKRALA